MHLLFGTADMSVSSPVMKLIPQYLDTLTDSKIDLSTIMWYGPSCSELTLSLVNDSLKFTSSDTQICRNFLLKKNVSSFCSAKATHIFSAKNIRILCIESAKTVNKMTLNELFKLTTLWTTGPWCFTSLSTVFKSYRDNGEMIKVTMQWGVMQSWAEFHLYRESNWDLVKSSCLYNFDPLNPTFI